MTALELTVLREASDDVGFVAGLALTDQLIVAVGGTSSHVPVVLASSNARHFEPRRTPRMLGLRHVVALGDALWACGEYGQLAVSRDVGATWAMVETGTEACLFGMAAAPDGAVWVVGDGGFAARVAGDRAERIDLQTSARLAAAYVVRGELVVLGGDGAIRRWRDGRATAVATGSTRPLSALAISRDGTWVVVGDGGFVARSPDGAWFTRARSGLEVDLEGIAALADGRIVAVGDRGHVLVSGDDARTWSAVARAPDAHLWSVAPFGAGALIGGDRGLILKLAPPGDRTWHDRVDVFGASGPLDAVFLAGPEGFVASRLRDYVAAARPEPAREPRGDSGDDGDGAAAILAAGGTAASFERIYGVPLPAEIARLRELAAGRDALFEELELDVPLLPDVGEHNLFELLVRRDQHAYLATGLIEAFGGVFGLGSQPSGDTYHLELYEWDGPRQVLHYDHERRAFTGVVADSVDSLVYLAALVRAHDDRAISRDVFELGLRRLHGKIAPSWQFSIRERDPDFVALDAKRRDSEFFFYRARWICALLAHDGTSPLDAVAQLFDPNFNLVVPADQLPARLEACERLIPTALYAMWRAFLFDEPELARYLELGRTHRARLVRDAAKLIDELRAGRNELGAIRDVRAHLDAFRALDLDPRRAAERAAEAEARARRDAARKQEVAGELARTPREGWPELAWCWLDDGIAHRALLEQLARTPDAAAQLAALAELRDLAAGERAIALPALAARLSPELEAVLVGSLVRDDRLTGALAADAAKDRDGAAGWAAIDRALAPIYGGAEPHAHAGTELPYSRGGNDPLHGISVYLRAAPVPHFHFVTYGFTDLFAKETENPEDSGFGFELSLRLARRADDTEVPAWALAFLQNLARYVFGTGNRFDLGHKMGLHGPMAPGRDTRLTAILFAADPELGDIESPFGRARFLEVVGITDDEYRLVQEWSTEGLAGILRRVLPVLVTDLDRASVLDDPAIAEEVRARVAAEGSSEDLTFAGDMSFELDGARVRITMGALYAAALPRAMRGRLRHGRPYTLRGRTAQLHVEPGEAAGWHGDREELVLVVPPAVIDELEEGLRGGLAGEYRFESWPELELEITPSLIRDAQGRAIEARGVEDEEEARRMLEEENARAGTLADEDEDEDEEEDGHGHGHGHGHGDEDGDEDGDGDGDAIAGSRVRAALALSERALRLAPDDEDVQFTHAMLLIDGERAGIAGGEALIAALASFAPQVRINVAMRLGRLRHAHFARAIDAVIAAAPAPQAELAEEVYAQLGEAVLELAPDRMARLVGYLPASIELLARLAARASQARRRDQALALYDRLLAMAMPDGGRERALYLRALHGAACAYAAAGDHVKAFEQVKRAVEHDYIHVPRIEVDRALGPILDWPEFKALVRGWRARQEGN